MVIFHYLHQNVVLGQEKGCNFRQFSDGGRVSIGDDAPQLVQCIV